MTDDVSPYLRRSLRSFNEVCRRRILEVKRRWIIDGLDRNAVEELLRIPTNGRAEPIPTTEEMAEACQEIIDRIDAELKVTHAEGP